MTNEKLSEIKILFSRIFKSLNQIFQISKIFELLLLAAWKAFFNRKPIFYI